MKDVKETDVSTKSDFTVATLPTGAKSEKDMVRMPKTSDGRPKFPSRSDGCEAGIVAPQR